MQKIKTLIETTPKSKSVRVSDKLTIEVVYFFSNANLAPTAEDIELYLRFDDYRNPACLGYQFLAPKNLMEKDEETKLLVEKEIKEYFKDRRDNKV